MDKKSLKVLFVASEATPYSTVGGLSRIMYFLPRALLKMGVDARVMIPRYGKIDLEQFKMSMCYEGLRVPTGDRDLPELVCNVKNIREKEKYAPMCYFLENMEYYEARANEYGYSDDPVRWALLARGATEFVRMVGKAARGQMDKSLKCEPWVPDVIHCNDWHTGLLPQYIKTVYPQNATLSKIATLFTIHNMHFQGNFDHHFVSDLDFDDGKSEIPSFFDERINKINSLRRGIMFSDITNTVSEKYSKEILTPEYGETLDQLLQEVRTKLYGVLNGIDYDDFNPDTDKIVKHNFNKRNVFSVRPLNKAELQAEFNLPKDPSVCVIATSFRLDEQKGLDLIIETIEHVLNEFPTQFIVNGDGEGKYKTALLEIAERHPGKVGLNLHANFSLPRHIFSGADIILLPSKFEPCGIVQMEAMRYGAVPVAREVGGLADTVTDSITGFTFKNFDRIAFYGTIVRALENYFHHPKVWQEMVKRCMGADFSWENSAKKYVELYQRAVELRVQKDSAAKLQGELEREE